MMIYGTFVAQWCIPDPTFTTDSPTTTAEEELEFDEERKKSFYTHECRFSENFMA